MKYGQLNQVFLKLTVTEDRVRGWHPKAPFIYTSPTLTRHLCDPYTDMLKRLSDFLLVSNRIPSQGCLSDQYTTVRRSNSMVRVWLWSHLVDRIPGLPVSLL